MPDKTRARAYVILFDPESRYLYFPIKRRDRNYGGMPQFFGGKREDGETNRESLSRELADESDNKLRLEAGGLKLVQSGHVEGTLYNFYVATNWAGTNFVGPVRNAEMESIQRFLTDADNDDTIDGLCEHLRIRPTAEFMESETYAAFNAALRWCDTIDTAGADDFDEV